MRKTKGVIMQYSNAVRIICECIAQSALGIKTSISACDDWKELFNESRDHSVLPLVYDTCGAAFDMPETVSNKYKSAVMSILIRNKALSDFQKQAIGLIEQNNYSYVVLKGFTTSALYFKSYLRTCGDVDILVRKKDFDAIDKLFKANGYQVSNETDHFHKTYFKDGFNVEIHFAITDLPSNECGKAIYSYFENCFDNRVLFEYEGNEFFGLDKTRQALMLLIHIERHMKDGGIGFRQLVDYIAFVNKYYDYVSSDHYDQLLSKCGFKKLSDTLIAIASMYFSCDFVYNDKYESLARELFNYACARGNFGHKRNLTQSLSDKSLTDKSGMGRFFVVRYYRYFCRRSQLTWKAAGKYKWLKYIGFIYIPLRYLARVITGKRKISDSKGVVRSSDEISSLYASFEFFKTDK